MLATHGIPTPPTTGIHPGKYKMPSSPPPPAILGGAKTVPLSAPLFIKA